MRLQAELSCPLRWLFGLLRDTAGQVFLLVAAITQRSRAGAEFPLPAKQGGHSHAAGGSGRSRARPKAPGSAPVGSDDALLPRSATPSEPHARAAPVESSSVPCLTLEVR